MQLKTVKISSLKPHKSNPNQHPQEQINELQNSLDQFDQIKNIVVWQNQVIAGCGLLEAALRQGREKIEVQDVSDWSEEKAIKFMISDNRLAELAIMDDDMLADLLKDFDEPLDIPGIDESFLDELDIGNEGGDGNTNPDSVSEVAKPVVKNGELWLLGKHRLLCGDCIKQENVERLMDGEKADMVFTDPPYGIAYAAKNEMLNAISPGNRIQTPIKGDHKTPDDMSIFWLKAFTLVALQMRKGACYYVTGPQGGDLHLLLLLALKESGFILKHTLIWAKNNHVLGRCDYNYKHEPILYGWVEGSHKFYGPSNETTLWEINKPLKSDLHPTMKPIELCERGIKNSSQLNNIVLDTFLGSGSTLIAAEKQNRICYGMEIDEHYCTIILQRWADYTSKDPVREDGVKFSELKNTLI